MKMDFTEWLMYNKKELYFNLVDEYEAEMEELE